MGPNKYVHLMFAIATLVAAFLFARTGEWLWGYFAKPNDIAVNGGALVLAGICGVLAYKSERVFAAAYDVTHELEKVSWPSRKETYAATVVVIVTVGVASLILWGFDMIWGTFANLVMR